MSLCCLKDHDLTTAINLTAIRDTGGLEVLVNLLETDDFKCKVKYTMISRLVLINKTSLLAPFTISWNEEFPAVLKYCI
jgi:hypothetical protein